MKKLILYFTLIIGIIFSCKKDDINKKDDIKKQQFNPTGNALDNANYTLDSTNRARLDSIKNLEDSIKHLEDSLNIIYMDIINNPDFGAFSGKVSTITSDNPYHTTYFYYYNDGRIAKISTTGVAMSPMGYKSHLIFSYQPDGFTIKEYLMYFFNEDNPYHNAAILEYKSDANHFITNVKNQLPSYNTSSYDEVKISYINNKINKIENYYNNVLAVSYYNNFLYDANDNLIFKSLNTHNGNTPIVDSIFYSYTNFTDEIGLNSDLNISYRLQIFPLNYTGYSIPTSNKLVKTIKYRDDSQTNIPSYNFLTYDYEFNNSNKLTRIDIGTKNYDQNNIETNSYNNSTDITYY